jgi:hypothetical protein
MKRALRFVWNEFRYARSSYIQLRRFTHRPFPRWKALLWAVRDRIENAGYPTMYF